MGSSRFDASTWAAHVDSVSSKPTAAVFTSRHLHSDLNPATFDVRESCDSAVNPESTPIIIAVDVTGSMGVLADEIVRSQLGTIVTEIYNRKPVSDPHIMVCAIGDAACDTAPIQATQFEAGVEPLVDQISRLWIEHGGGGNEHESYLLPLLLAASKTRCDSQIKRGRKGFIFTFGDENSDPGISKAVAKRFLNLDIERDLTCEQLLSMIQPNWHYFHGVVKDTTSCMLHSLDNWRRLIGQRVLDIQDIGSMAEIIVSTMQIVAGDTVDTVVKSWGDPGKGALVRSAIKDLAVVGAGTGDSIVSV